MQGREPRPVIALIGLTSSSSQRCTATPNISQKGITRVSPGRTLPDPVLRGSVNPGSPEPAGGMVWLGACRCQLWWPAFYAVPVQTFTFLFTDIEGSTALLGRVGQDVYARVLAGHHAIIRSGLAAHGGREVDTQGDAFFAVFSSSAACVAAVIQMQQALQAHAWPGGEQVRVRMGVHTGEA